jgi:hypothetical protein
VQDAAAFLKYVPDDARVDYHHFGILGEDFKKRRLITIYRIGDEELEGDELDCLPCSVEGSTLFLSSLEQGYWEEQEGQYGLDQPVG